MHSVPGFLLQKEKYPMRENPESSQPNVRARGVKYDLFQHQLFRVYNIVSGKYSQFFNISETYFKMLGNKLLEN